MNILAIDPGQDTGFAYGSTECALIQSGVWNLKPDRWCDLGSRVIRLREHLRKVFALGVDLVVYEEVRGHKGTDAAHIYGAVVGALQVECRMAGVNYEGVPVGTIKKHATGKGNAGKPAMMDAARERGWSFKDDNEADALWILDWRLNGG